MAQVYHMVEPVFNILALVHFISAAAAVVQVTLLMEEMAVSEAAEAVQLVQQQAVLVLIQACQAAVDHLTHGQICQEEMQALTPAAAAAAAHITTPTIKVVKVVQVL